MQNYTLYSLFHECSIWVLDNKYYTTGCIGNKIIKVLDLYTTIYNMLLCHFRKYIKIFHNVVFRSTVQDDSLARVIFGEFVCRKLIGDLCYVPLSMLRLKQNGKFYT